MSGSELDGLSHMELGMVIMFAWLMGFMVVWSLFEDDADAGKIETAERFMKSVWVPVGVGALLAVCGAVFLGLAWVLGRGIGFVSGVFS